MDTERPISNPNYRRLQDQLYEVNVEIQALKDRQKELTRLIQQYQERVDQAPVREQEWLALMRDYENTQNRYRALLDKKLSVEISENLQRQIGGEEFRMLEPATVPEKPIKPDLLKIILVAIVSGIGAGIGLVTFIEYSDTSFHKSEDLEKVTGLKVFCTIPHFVSPRPDPRRDHSGERYPPSVIVDQPQSLVAEQYRLLCAKIHRLTKDSSAKVLAFTSAVIEEGKSTTALNVALAMASDFKKRTLLIEGDLQKPVDGRLHRREIGLVEVLTGQASLESAFVRFPSSALMLLRRGGGVSKMNPVELLGGSEMQEVVEQLKKRFECILLDCPPLLAMASTGLIAEVADAMVLVVRAENTPRSLVLKAIATLEDKKIIGVVFNDAKHFEIPSKYYYNYTHV